jgi:cell division protein FtsB
MSFARAGLVASLFVSCLAVFAHTMLSADGWSRRSRLAKDLLTVKTQNDALEERVNRLRRQITALNTRPAVQEQVIRDELGYVRGSDMILHFGQ